jgi:hypothetical protein
MKTMTMTTIAMSKHDRKHSTSSYELHWKLPHKLCQTNRRPIPYPKPTIESDHLGQYNRESMTSLFLVEIKTRKKTEWSSAKRKKKHEQQNFVAPQLWVL